MTRHTDRDGARRWRELGYAAERVRAAARRPVSDPGEAAAFVTARVDAEAVVLWVEAGFSAEEARGWTDADVRSNEARVWRSVGLGPVDARRQWAAAGGALPESVEVGWFSYGGGAKVTTTAPPILLGHEARSPTNTAN